MYVSQGIMAASKSMKRFLHNIDFSLKLIRKRDSYQRYVYNVLSRYQSQWSKVEDASMKEAKDASSLSRGQNCDDQTDSSSRLSKYSSDEEDDTNNKWKLELSWLSKALEPALQLCRGALPAGVVTGNRTPPSSRSLVEIVASIQRSKLGLQDWSLGDLTIGLYLIYLQQASTNPFEDVKGVQISSDTIVQDLIYHIELAKGAYRDAAAGLARNSMLRETNVVKFVKNSSMLRPGYYIGIDKRNKLVILGIRGTQSVYDLITDVVTSCNGEVSFEGYSTHFGTAEAARWFLIHEMGTIKKYLEKHEGFRLRLVGHSLGGAIASVLAIMLRKKTSEELGFNPDIVTAVAFATQPCVSRELAESCSDYVTTICMQDDIVPRLSAASVMRLRNEILQTDWKSVFEKEDWKRVVHLVTNAKQVVSSVQGVAQKLVNFTKFGTQAKFIDIPGRKDSIVARSTTSSASKHDGGNSIDAKDERHDCTLPEEELFVPGTVYYLKRHEVNHNGNSVNLFTLWKRHKGEHFQRILLSSNLISDHKCDAHYYALRDVLKSLPRSQNQIYPK